MTTVLLLALYLALPPLLVGIVNRVKAILAGRRGPPLWQVYADLARLACRSHACWPYQPATLPRFAAAPRLLHREPQEFFQERLCQL